MDYNETKLSFLKGLLYIETQLIALVEGAFLKWLTETLGFFNITWFFYLGISLIVGHLSYNWTRRLYKQELKYRLPPKLRSFKLLATFEIALNSLSFSILIYIYLFLLIFIGKYLLRLFLLKTSFFG